MMATLLLVAGTIGACVALIMIGWAMNRRRRQRLDTAAAARGWSYAPDRDTAVAEYFSFLNQTDRGTNHYATDVLRGTWRGWSILAFTHHAKTVRRNRDGDRRTRHHRHAVVALHLGPQSAIPELTIAPAGLLDRLGKLFAEDDRPPGPGIDDRLGFGHA